MDATGGGRILTNRPDYHSNYSGLEFTLNKRLANRWMTRVAFSINSWTEHYAGRARCRIRRAPIRRSSGTLSGPQVDGGQIAPRSGGSGKGDLFYNARWQLNANGFYQLGRGFDLGANLFARQGYVNPYIFQVSAGGDGSVRALAVDALDDVRNPNLFDLDLRLAKNIRMQRVEPCPRGGRVQRLERRNDRFSATGTSNRRGSTRSARSSARAFCASE